MTNRPANYDGPADYLEHLPDLQTIPMLVEEFIVGMLDEVIYPGRDVSVIDLSDRVTADRIRDAATALVVDVFTTATSREEMRRRLIDGTRLIASDYQQRWPSTPLAAAASMTIVLVPPSARTPSADCRLTDVSG